VRVVATDHCPFRQADKARGLGDFTKIPNGAPGIEHRLPLLYDAGVATGRFPVERFVEVTAAEPARIFGLWPRKGVVAVGADADLVVFDPSGATRVSAATHHMRVDYNLYEGRTLTGAIDLVMARGDVVVEGGRFVGASGRGRFLKRAPFAP
jgi:dihydropyrimidinase